MELKTAAAILLIVLTGCAGRRPMGFEGVEAVTFRNCQLTEQRDDKTSCDCRRIDWIRDIKAHRWIAVCMEPNR